MFGPSEDELKAAFDKQDSAKKGKISVPRAGAALQDLGMSEEDAARKISDACTSDTEEAPPEEQKKKKGFFSRMFSRNRMPKSQELSFEEFKVVACGRYSNIPDGKKVDDTPVVGVVSSAFADAFGVGSHGKTPDPAKVEEAFKAIAKDGKLDKRGVAEALRQLGKSERQVQKVVDAMTVDEYDLDAFKELFAPPPRPWTTEVGSVPVPNREKILDIPVIGHTMNFLGHLLTEPTDHAARKLHKHWGATDVQLIKEFWLMDTDRDGLISSKVIADTMRTKGAATELEIKAALEEFEKTKRQGLTLYEFKKAIRGPKFAPSSVSLIPAIGESFSTNVGGHHEYSEDDEYDDLEEAWCFICLEYKGVKGLEVYGIKQPKTEAPEGETKEEKEERLKKEKEAVKATIQALKCKIDKHQLYLLCLELGMSDHLAQQVCDGYAEEEIDYTTFKQMILDPEGRPWLLESFPFPNPAKVHDTPIIGALTKGAQDAAVGLWSWTGGAIVRRVKPPTDEDIKAKWAEFDTANAGKLPKSEVAKVLRALGEYEGQIKAILESISKDPVTFDELKVAFKGAPAEEPAK